MRLSILLVVLFSTSSVGSLAVARLHAADAVFQAGAAMVDVTPRKLPVLVNGGMTSRSLEKVKTPVTARAIVCSDGQSTLAIVIVDSCMMGRQLLDDIKALAAIRTGIPANRILIAATHAHSAPASMGCLGTDADPDYVPFLREQLVEVMLRQKSDWSQRGLVLPASQRQTIRRSDSGFADRIEWWKIHLVIRPSGQICMQGRIWKM